MWGVYSHLWDTAHALFINIIIIIVLLLEVGIDSFFLSRLI